MGQGMGQKVRKVVGTGSGWAGIVTSAGKKALNSHTVGGDSQIVSGHVAQSAEVAAEVTRRLVSRPTRSHAI
jgi:hypothetical protein